MIEQENKVWRHHHHTCVTDELFALQEPHAVLCLGGCMHDCAYTLSTTSTPCAYLHTQSCLVSLGLKTSSTLFEIRRLSCLSTATCVSHQCWLCFSLSASLRLRRRDLKVSGGWDVWAEVICGNRVGPCVDLHVAMQLKRLCVWARPYRWRNMIVWVQGLKLWIVNLA